PQHAAAHDPPPSRAGRTMRATASKPRRLRAGWERTTSATAAAPYSRYGASQSGSTLTPSVCTSPAPTAAARAPGTDPNPPTTTTTTDSISTDSAVPGPAPMIGAPTAPAPPATAPETTSTVIRTRAGLTPRQAT